MKSTRVQEYEAQGFLIERGVFTPAEMAALGAEATSLLDRHELIKVNNLRCRWQNHVETGECLFETFDPIIDLSPAFAAVVADRRILDRLAALYGEEGCLFKDKLIFKPPGARGYDLHQDYIAWPGFPRSFLTVLLSLDRADRSNGCTEVFPGYHQGGYLSHEDGNYHPLPPETVDEADMVSLDLDPGDLAIFGCFTPHRSAPNLSTGWRRQLYISYNAFSDGGAQRERHYEEFHRWLRARYAEHGKKDVYFQ
jgi:hypothetical protein